ncbi:MAG: GTPase Era [Oligosphaeraceae bacterium]
MESLSPTTPPKGRTGYVALLGRPNTGKSTFLNTVLGCHLAAVSSKPQTTRKSFLGIYNDEDSQIIFLDAPGVHPSRLAIDEAMSLSVSKVLEDADLVVCLADPTRTPGEEDAMAATMAAQCAKKVLLVLNKSDLTTPEQRQRTRAFYEEKLPQVETLEMSAISPDSAHTLIRRLKELLPTDLLLYDRDEVTTAYERDIAAELIREAVLELLREEIPHAIAVTLDSWTNTEKGPSLEATLILEREAHKGIVIGQGGKMIKAIRHHAVKKISELCQGGRVELALQIRVVPNWRKHKQFLKNIRLWES